MDREWRPIPGWENLYDVSDDGLVRRTPGISRKGAVPGRILSPNTNQHGHMWVTLFPGKHKMYLHRAVALAFIPRNVEGDVVRHLDDVPSNNVIANLAWGTQKDNVADMIRHGRADNGRRHYTHCPQGHAYDEQNTRVNKRNERICRACDRARYWNKKKEMA